MFARTPKKKVFVGLSGGVDSAVSAALLLREGYEVVGVFIRIALPGYPCPATEDRHDAMRAAAHLRIPFKEIDLSSAYQEQVFKHSLEEFARGRTPNPDTLCNREIKFGLFFDYAMREGADFVATGHYARIHNHARATLYAGHDTEKDQTYFLWMVKEAKLSKTLFPVGGFQKSEVRALAKKFSLPNARRRDSQGLCFLGPIGVADMLTRELRPTPGDVLSEQGEVIGAHEGALLYTLGQRHGFRVAPKNASAAGPLYVISKDISKNTITVSEHPYPQGAMQTSVTLSSTNWIGEVQNGPCVVRYRYRQTFMQAELFVEGDQTTVLLEEPRYVPEGQSLVVYRKEGDLYRCLGGGVVDKSILQS